MANRLVLVVDDDLDNREGIAEYLSACGFEVTQAGTGHEALAAARERVPSAVVLDLQLPGLDGYEVAKRLRNSPDTRDVRLVAFSACVYPQDHARALDAGCDEFIDKPAAPTAVVAVLDRLLGTRTSRPSI